MSKHLSIEDIIRPSMGSAISIKPLLDSYIIRYNQFSAKDIKMYYIPNGNSYVVHVLVPSEKNDEFEKSVYYDVVIEFYPVTKENANELTLKNYGVRLFSNSINWMFNFTYVFAKNGHIPHFIPKSYYSAQALKEPPKKTNPYGIYGVERVVFIAFYHLEIITGFRKNRVDLVKLDRMDVVKMSKTLMGQDEKLAQLNLEEKKLKITKKAAKLKIKQEGKINIINKKERALGQKLKTVDKELGADMKRSFESNIKDKNMRKNMVAAGGLKANLKSNLSKKK
ncbi:MAG: hypothetical protein ACRC5M_06795 [Anaeroplasmataceae bacterium]